MCCHVKFGSSVTEGTHRTESPNLGELGPPPCGRGICPLKTSSLSISVTVSNLVVLRERLYAEIEGNQKNWGPLDLRRLAVGAWMSPYKYAPSPRVILPNLVVLRTSNGTSVTK